MLRARFATLSILLTFGLSAAFAQQIEKRVAPIEVSHRLALVIGNVNYKSLQTIPPARNDAQDLSGELNKLGFRVTTLYDLNLVDLIRAVGTFRAGIQPGDVALFYYSGHGGQLDEENYLLPVDYDPPSRVDADLVPRRAYKMSELRDKVESSSARVRIFIFDACRSSPVLTTKDSSKDYAPVSGKPEGTLIAFASAHLQPAGFTTGSRNSDYTQELLAALRQPKIPDLEALLMDVRGRVFQRTSRTQTPYLYGFLSGPLYLAGEPKPPAPPPPAPVVQPVTSPAMNEVTSLLIESDADATVLVDDQPGVEVKTGQMKRFTVGPGTHFLRAVSGPVTLKKTVEVRHGEQQAVSIELASVVASQAAALRSAAPGNGLIGLWTLHREWDDRFTDQEHKRFHAASNARLLVGRTQSGELTATFHEEQNIKGIDDASINATRTNDALFRVQVTGSVWKGVSDSASLKWQATEKPTPLTNVSFDANLLDDRNLKFKIVWQRDAKTGAELNTSLGTLTKQN